MAKFIARSVVVCMILMYHNICYSQSENADSLLVLVNNSNGTERCDHLINLVRELANSDNKAALKYGQVARELAYKLGDTARIITSSRIVGQLFNRLSLNRQAEEILSDILPICQRSNLRRDYKIILSNLAIAYTYQAQYDKSLKINFQALELMETDDDFKEMTLLLNNIGVVYYKLKDYKRGLSYFQEALQLKKSINDTYDLDRLLVNMSLCYASLNTFSKAKVFNDSALSICGKQCDINLIADATFCYGVIQFGLGNWAGAEKLFLKSYKLSRESENIRYMLDNVDYLCQLYIASNQLTKASSFLKEAEELIKDSTVFNLELIKLYSRFIELCEKNRDFKRLADYQKKYINLKDYVYNEAVTSNLMKIEAEHLQRENTARIEAQKQVIALTEKNVENQRLLNLLTGMVAFFFLMVILLLVRINKNRRSVNLILEQKVKERTNELVTSRDLWQTAYKEKEQIITRISKEIQSSVATLKGLSEVGIKEIRDPNALNYLNQIEITSSNLTQAVFVINSSGLE